MTLVTDARPLIERLREYAGVLEHLGPIGYDKTLREAADAIEKAEASIEDLKLLISAYDSTLCAVRDVADSPYEVTRIINNALGQQNARHGKRSASPCVLAG